MNSIRHILILLAILVTLSANAQREGITTFTYYPNSSLEVLEQNNRVTSVNITKGKNLILVYEFRSYDNPHIADDEYKEKIYIEIKDNPRKFDVKSEQVNVYFMKGCYCTDRGYHKALPGGTIRGRKNIIGDYRVRGSLRFKTSEEFKGEFNKEQYFDAAFLKYKAKRQ